MKIHSVPSPHFNKRPADTPVDTVVLHCMYVPTAPRPFDPLRCLKTLKQEKVSCHYLISRRGRVIQCVPDDQRAWHAGVSRMPFSHDQRENVNHFSIGIELVGKPEGTFTDLQYRSLVNLLSLLMKPHPIRALVGHDEIAPGRKHDPGSALDWDRLLKELGRKIGISRARILRGR